MEEYATIQQVSFLRPAFSLYEEERLFELRSNGMKTNINLPEIWNIGKDSLFLWPQSTMSIEYAYDKNGNLTRDTNKGMKFTYDLLGRPLAIVGSDNQTDYVYSADGRKFRATHTPGNNHILIGSNGQRDQYSPIQLRFLEEWIEGWEKAMKDR